MTFFDAFLKQKTAADEGRVRFPVAAVERGVGRLAVVESVEWSALCVRPLF
jgi:hypothetical protein